MTYSVTIDLFYVLLTVFFAVVFYLYTRDNGDDRLTQMRHNVEVKKEWFRMLAEQNKQKFKRGRK